MFPLSDNFYAAWRARLGAANLLHEENGLPPERLLQAIWLHQRLRRDQLKTVEGKTIRVFHPGFVSAEGGPDFRGAVIQIGDDAPCSGDVEVDVRAGNWHAHGHDRNPDFHNVLLHVVWDEIGVRTLACWPDNPAYHRIKLQPQPPTLAIGDKLDAPLSELGLWLESELLQSFPENLRGQCCVPLGELDEAQLAALLRGAAAARFQAKAAQFRARAQLAGWEQSLWEGLFCALGYKQNTWPMQHLAETRRRWAHGTNSVFELQARLFGISSLLPSELPRVSAGSNDYLRRIWDCWWRERDEFSDYVLPRAAWKFRGLRPANHPQRRLALAAHWLKAGDLIQKLERWCAADLPDRILPRSLHKIFEVPRDEFWSWHWTFRSGRLEKPQMLLGSARATDLAINVALPWLWSRAVEGKNERLQRVLKQRYFVWPPTQDNSVLRLVRQRLLDRRRRLWPNAAVQQGLMQIAQDFCGRSNALCVDCRFPELARGWRAQAVIEP